LNIITDDSSNINLQRIANISVHTNAGAFFYASEDVGAARRTAHNVAIWMKEKIVALSNDNLLRVNSIATDTCATMSAVWGITRKDVDLKHVLFVPCDAHGLQLVVKDLLDDVPILHNVHQKAQTIAHAFRSAPLQYGRLRDFQMQHYNTHLSLILAVITRWGTQYRLVESLRRSRDALRAYANDPERLASDLRDNAVHALKDPVF
jgi:hypothetical protein